jgi:hypothetical protein
LVYPLPDNPNIDTARRIAKENGQNGLFPELGSVAVEEPDKFDYIIQREEFEKQFPSRIARQVPNAAAWAAPTKKNKNIKPATDGPEVEKETADSGKREGAEEIVEEQAGPGASPFEVTLDDAQRKALQKIRERRERLRGGTSKK